MTDTMHGPIAKSQYSDIKITDFCDMDAFAKMMQDWAVSTGLATAALDNEGNYLCEFYNFTDFCMKYNRSNPLASKACAESDHNGNGIYICHAGLIDFSAPITLEDGTVLGTILGGQVLPSAPDEEKIRADARAFGINENEYIEALHHVNIRSRATVEASAGLLSNMINMFVRTSYLARSNAQSLTERSNIISSLSRIYFCSYYIDLDADTFIEIDVPEHLHQFTSHQTSASQLLQEASPVFAEAEYQEDFQHFNDLSTLPLRLSQKQNISFEFLSPGSGWNRSLFIVVSRDHNNRVTHVLYVLQHIQEEKEKELQIQQKLKNAADQAIKANNAKSEFLSRMSHDIRTPMNGIIGMTHIAMEQKNDAKTEDCLKKIEKSSSYLLGLINDVLDMSRIESGEITLHQEPYPEEEFDQYMDSVLRPLADAKHQTFLTTKDISHEYIPILDKLRFNQIVFNLISNAIKYTPDHGHIEYHGYERMENGKMIMTLVIKDNGQGMSDEFQKILFEPYTQEDRVRNMNANSGSSGLGLAIVRKLINLMHGSITVVSHLNQGSTFTVILPLDYISIADYRRSETEHLYAGSDSLQGKRVLLCEDNEINQEIAVSILRRYGIAADIADNGQVGVSMFGQSAPGTYYAILMDLRMPLMDGYEAAQAVRSLPRSDAADIPIIAMTADVFEGDIQHCISVGMNAHIAKPIEPNLLYDTLLKYINQK